MARLHQVYFAVVKLAQLHDTALSHKVDLIKDTAVSVICRSKKTLAGDLTQL